MTAVPAADPPTPVPDGAGLRRSFATRIGRALRLRADVFEEVAHDPGALGQATVVVIAAGLARGLGALPEEGLPGLVGSTLGALVAWIVAAALVSAVGVWLFEGTSDVAELLRALGFAAAPLVGLVVRVLPLGPLDLPLVVVLHAAALGGLVIAARQALDVSTSTALLVVLVALAVGVGILLLVGLSCFGEAVLFL